MGKTVKVPSMKLFFAETIGLLGLSFISFINGSFVLASAFFIGNIANIIRVYKKGMKSLENDDVEEIEEKESLFSRFKNKIKSLGKKKTKVKNKKGGLISRIKNRKNKKEEVEIKNDTINEEENINEIKEDNSKSKIDDIKKQKEDLKNLRQDIIDGVYALKKDQIIQDKINGREINNYYKQKVYKK